MVNIDQTGVAFVQGLDSTYADAGERNRGTVDLLLPNPSMRLRMATLQVLLCNDPSVLPCPPTNHLQGAGGAEAAGTQPVRPSRQGSVASDRVDGHQFVPPVDLERVQAIVGRCLSRPRAHRFVGQCDASPILRRDPENEETALCHIVRAESTTEHWQPLDALAV